MNDFINLVKDGAIKAQKEHGICAALTIAQAILESGWGKHSPGNNLFGIKWQEGCGYDRQLLPTYEYENGQRLTIQDWFRAYNSLQDSVYDHAQFLVKNNRYSNLLGVLDYQIACKLIQEDGYATDPNYANLLMQIIEENELYKFDVLEENDMDKVVLYFGDADVFSAIMLSQKFQCPLMKLDDYKNKTLTSKEVIQVGGPGATVGGSDRFETFKNAGGMM